MRLSSTLFVVNFGVLIEYCSLTLGSSLQGKGHQHDEVEETNVHHRRLVGAGPPHHRLLYTTAMLSGTYSVECSNASRQRVRHYEVSPGGLLSAVHDVYTKDKQERGLSYDTLSNIDTTREGYSGCFQSDI